MVSPGTTLGGRYKLDDRIAGGGMGDVWRGTDEVLGRTVAVKILLPALLEEPGFAERFRGEARTMATINHPGVVDIYDYGSDPKVGAYLVMEYVEGDALSRTLSRVGRLTPARTMALMAQAADALQAAHDKGIVHRDVKPGNLLVRPNGTLVLTDFGIARSAMVGQLTQVGSVLGTASYISPEQAAGAVATSMSDVYALGVVAYQCLSGRRPFEGDNPLEIALKHVREQPPPLPADIPPAVRGIVDRAMAKDPTARFPSAAALGQVARRAAAGLTTTAAGLGPSGAPVSVPPVPSQTSPGALGTMRQPNPTGPRPPTGPVPRPPTMAPGAARATGYPAAGQTSGAGTRPGVPTSGAPGRPAVPTSGAPGRPNSGASVNSAGYGRAVAPAPPVRPNNTGYFSPTGSVPTSQSGGRTTAIILGLLIGLLVLLLLIGVLVALSRTSGDTGSTDPGNAQVTQTQSATRGTGGTGSAQLVDLPCNAAKGRSYTQVKQELEGAKFKVQRVDVTGAANRVVSIPCQAAKGSTVQVQVGNGTGTATKGGPGSQPTATGCGVGAPISGCPASPTPKKADDSPSASG
jgi:serine/threonine-protein kinase